MYVVTRRSFLAGAAVVPFSAWLERTAAAQGNMKYVRYEARTNQGQAMLVKYAQAVAKMKATPASDPLSWVFQWYTHWVKGPQRPFNDVLKAKNDALQQIFPNGGRFRELAQEMWDNCEAHGAGIIPPNTPNFPPENEDFFLPWHRCYVYFFERIVRSFAGNDFALPYWNYSTDDLAVRGVIPPEFTKQSDPTFGSLFVENRNPGVNDGKPIQGDDNGPNGPLSLDALSLPTYDAPQPAGGFCQQLDFGLHGNVHVLVGDTTNMGSVPFAAGDPIFWMHHSNIDRLWASWNAAGRQNPTLEQQFAFADVDKYGKPQRVVANIKDFLDIAKLGYAYDRLEPVPNAALPAAALADRSRSAKRHAAARGITLGAAPVQVALEPQAEADGAAARPIPERVRALGAQGRIYLVVRDLRADVPPGVVYNVYLDLPANPSRDQMAAHRAGVINFFHALGHGGADAAAPAAGHGAMMDMFRSFDVTNVARSLQANGRLSEKPVLTIAPAGKPAAAKPVVGEAALVEL